MLELAFPQRLGGADKLPAKVREQLDEQAGGEVALVDALIKAGEPAADAGEPSWGVLGHFIRETRFIQVYRRLKFMKVNVGRAVPRLLGPGARTRCRPSLSIVPGSFRRASQ